MVEGERAGEVVDDPVSTATGDDADVDVDWGQYAIFVQVKFTLERFNFRYFPLDIK